MDCSAIHPPAAVYPNVQAIHNGQSCYSCGQPGHRQCDCPMGSQPWRQGGAVPAGPITGRAAYPPRAQPGQKSMGGPRAVTCLRAGSHGCPNYSSQPSD
ncbi:MAG: hypothetical protein GY696_31890 [Gammaproteobacteria bacterium]|nr:hypothetical protein [Gammaproteobacteria bacterium]